MKLPLLTAAGEQVSRLQARDIQNAISQVSRLQARDVQDAFSQLASATINHITPTIRRRESSSTCAANDTSAQCVKPADSTNMQTVAIALGVGIPLGCAVIVLYLLHRRHLKKQRIEDMNDPHKSLDFGMNGKEYNTGGKGSKGRGKHPEMTIKDMSTREIRGLSMNMDSPYLLAGDLHGSRSSMRSMPRSLHDDSDPYRPVEMYKNDWDSSSIRSPRAAHNPSLPSPGGMHSGSENASLIANARPMSQSFPKRGDSTSPHNSNSSDEVAADQLRSRPERKAVPSRKQGSSSSIDKPLPILQTQPLDLGDFIPPPPPSPPPKTEGIVERPPRTSSRAAPVSSQSARDEDAANHPIPSLPQVFEHESSHQDDFDTPPPPPPHDDSPYDSHMEPELDYYDHHSDTHESQNTFMDMRNNRMSIMGLRPLPSDLPDDNPEQRANRIRSFYKEYFDDSRPNPKGGYVDDYDASYLADYALYDNALQSKPFAQPMGRRAMTPPPRGGNGPSYGPGPHRRHMSTQSGGHFGPRGRAASAPRKRQPPPAALTSLPTPHRLKDNDGIFNALDFAPPSTFRDRQNGRRPDSPLGISRPYSPSVAAHSPLVASYDELPAVPSPHLLRKSGTFTALDFAPPPRFKDGGNASDAGSIRSNRSGISHKQQNAIRAGAYRVSRIPTEMVTTKDDLSLQLKPRWDMRGNDNSMG